MFQKSLKTFRNNFELRLHHSKFQIPTAWGLKFFPTIFPSNSRYLSGYRRTFIGSGHRQRVSANDQRKSASLGITKFR